MFYFGDDSFGANLSPPSELGGWIHGDRAVNQLSLYLFVPYVEVFFERLYPVFPVIDKASLVAMLQSVEDPAEPLPAGLYPFLSALAAAVIVQLNAADLQASQLPTGDFRSGVKPPPDLTAKFFVRQCLQTRQDQDFIEDANEWTILTSFFLFAYYGNMDQSRSAWYYLREAISFAQTLGLEDAESYVGLDLQTRQRRQRLFWLLFITERFLTR